MKTPCFPRAAVLGLHQQMCHWNEQWHHLLGPAQSEAWSLLVMFDSHQAEPETPAKNDDEYEKLLKTEDPSASR